MMQKVSLQAAKILVVKFAGTFGSGMLSFAIGLYILQRTGSALSMGISLITGPLVTVCLTPFVGYVVDTKSHKLVMAVAQAVTIGALILFALLFSGYPARYYPELIGLIIVLQVTDNFLYTTVQASLVQLFAEDERQQVNSLNQSMSSLASFLAPIMGALVYTLVSIDKFAYIEVIFELVALVAIFTLRFQPSKVAEKVAEVEPKQSVVQNFVAGVRYMISQRLVMVLSLSSAAINFFFATLNLGLPYLLVHTLRLSNTEYGVTDSAFAVGMFIGGIWLSQLKLKHHPVKVSFFNLGLFALLLAFMGVPVLFSWTAPMNTVLFVILNTVLGIILVFVNTPWETFMQKVIPEQMQGRVFSLDETISTVLMPVGTLFYGALFDHYGAVPIFAITGVLMLGMVVGFMVLITRKRLLQSV